MTRSGVLVLSVAVETHLAPAMDLLGYHYLGIWTQTDAGTVHEGAPRDRWRVVTYGFEARSEADRRRVLPDDPDSADEMWLGYDQDTCALDIRSWQPVAQAVDAARPIEFDLERLDVVAAAERVQQVAAYVATLVQGAAG